MTSSASPVLEDESASLDVNDSGSLLRLIARGVWTAPCIADVDETMREALAGQSGSVEIDTSAVIRMDTTGAWLVERARHTAQANGASFEHIDDNQEHLKLIEAIAVDSEAEEAVEPPPRLGIVGMIGRAMSSFGNDFLIGCNIIGAVIWGQQQTKNNGSSIRLISIVNQIDHMGLRAVPVISLMSFLIGGIIAQQGAFQLRLYGAELFVANLVGILHLREIGVLLTAIMVAGRTGSAITAEIGTMKMREEIDALTVMGLNPIGILISPRLIALIIVMPMLTIVADLMGVLGAVFVSWLYVGIQPSLFIQTLQSGIDYSTFLSGLIKAPFMALIIGVVAAIEGTKVEGSAESLGQRTTSSVVKSIFVVIVVDGLFAMFYAAINY